ncbi:hypothetical protein AAG906_021153 [Vitis piasezkii]
MHVSASRFKRLKVLQIDELTGLTRLNIDEGALPWLKQLQAYYGTKILGINNLLNLVDSRVLIERDHLLVPIQMPYPNSPIHSPWDSWTFLLLWVVVGDVYMHVSVPLLRCDFDQASLLIHGQCCPSRFHHVSFWVKHSDQAPDKAHSSRPHGEAHNSRSTWGTYSTRRDYPIIRMVAAIFLAILRMGDLLIQKAVFLKGCSAFRKKQCKATQPKRSKMMGGFIVGLGASITWFKVVVSVTDLKIPRHIGLGILESVSGDT